MRIFPLFFFKSGSVNALLTALTGGEENDASKKPAGNSGSALWRALLRIWDKVNYGLRWAIGNGDTAPFWLDPFVLKVLLIDVVVHEILENLCQLRVRQFVTCHGGCD